MIFDRLESGILLFETPQGIVRVDLSLRQRLYLLWTFRNFRQLSMRQLNQRQRNLVNFLYQSNTGAITQTPRKLPVIGMVEDFAPAKLPPDLVPAVRIDAWLAQSPIQKTVQRKRKQDRPEKLAPSPAKAAPKRAPVPAPSLAISKSTPPRLAPSRLATTVGALSLCIVSVLGWHRIQAIPASQAQTQFQPQPAIELHNAAAVPNTQDSTVSAAAAAADSPATGAPATATTEPSVAHEADVTATQIDQAQVAQTQVAQNQVAQDPVAPTQVAEVIPAPVLSNATGLKSTPVPVSKPAVRVHEATPNHSGANQESAIQAARPPLRFVYPVCQDGCPRGVVSLTAGLDSDGIVRAVRVISGNRTLAAAAVRAVRQWRYRPYLKDGQPVATETNVVISFFSDEAVSMTFPPSIPAAH